ncbi:GNAT family N-acyltransferase [Shewanella maritima]|uniref:GNAT family N-acyltransferase n=1 Tax=Shewanella maritima TaxID=2520507 RepID=UPI00373519EE
MQANTSVPLFSVEKMMQANLPVVNNSILNTPVKTALQYLFHEQQCNQIADKHAHLSGIDFIEQVLAEFDVSYAVPNQEIENIPVTGRLVIYANHPIGSLDALALIKLISQVRTDIKVVANELLMAIPQLHSILIPVKNLTGGTPKQHIATIHQWLNNEGVVIIFPSGEVSRLRPHGVTDLKWNSGFLRFAKSCHAPLLPIYIDAKNSASFYGASMLYKPLASLLLVKEMFKQGGNTLPMRIGELIAKEVVASNEPVLKSKVALLKNHLYRIGKDRSGLFPTQKAIAHPEPRQQLQTALSQCTLLGETPDNKQIYLYQHQGSNPIMREIGRLREVAFRAVGEGTGKRRDIDKYDNSYCHLVLWDPQALEIAGAYRFACVQQIFNQDPQGLYSQTLFHYSPQFQPYFEQGLELGRSFVQPKYWGRRSLEYLWLGIGAYLRLHPQYRYLFGAVSLTPTIPKTAKDLIVYFYLHHFADRQQLATSTNPYVLCSNIKQTYDQLFSSANYADNFKTLKRTLSNMEVSVPTLFKQYSELCDQDSGGVKFIDFGTDPEFGDCIDGLVLVDIHQLKATKQQKYITSQVN